jgi:hypothetical protein
MEILVMSRFPAASVSGRKIRPASLCALVAGIGLAACSDMMMERCCALARTLPESARSCLLLLAPVRSQTASDRVPKSRRHLDRR